MVFLIYSASLLNIKDQKCACVCVKETERVCEE